MQRLEFSSATSPQPSFRFLASITRILLGWMALCSSVSAQEAWTLQRCIDHAFEHNLQIKQAQLGEVSASINSTSARGAFLPNLNANASHGYNFGRTIDPFTNNFVESSAIQSNSFGLSTGLTLFNGFQNHLNLKRAQLQEKSAEAASAVAQNNVILTIAGAYLNVLFQEEFVRLAEVNRDVTQRQVERVTQLVNAGAAAEADLLDVSAQLASDEASIVSSSNGLDLAKLNLVQLLQLPANSYTQFTVVRPSDADLERQSLPASPDAAVAHALSTFPEMQQAQYRVEDAELARDLARAGNMPRLYASFNIGTGYSGASQSISGPPTTEEFLLGSLQVNDTLAYDLIAEQEVYQFITTPFSDQVEKNFNQSLFFSLSVPLFNNFNVRSAKQQAEVNVLQSEYQLEQTRQGLRASIESAWADAKAANQTSVAQESALIAADKAFQNTEKRYEAGASTAIEFADARARLDNARVNTLRSKYDFAFKSRILNFYMGRAITFR